MLAQIIFINNFKIKIENIPVNLNRYAFVFRISKFL